MQPLIGTWGKLSFCFAFCFSLFFYFSRPLTFFCGSRNGAVVRAPMWPGFDSQTRRHMWVEFVGSLLCTDRFSPGLKTNI